MINLIFFGSPGAGKGTQAERTAAVYGLAHLSSGESLRREAKKEDEFGKKIRRFIDRGVLVPDEMIIEMMENEALEKSQGKGFIFDGFPRSLHQVEALETFLKKNDLDLDAVINLNLSEEEAKKRIILRGQSSGRTDDNLKIIHKRFKIYHEQTEPLLDYYRQAGKIVDIDGAPDMDTVFNSIKTVIENLKNRS